MVLRRDADALRAFGRALALDPQRMISLGNMSSVYIYQGRDAEATALLDSAIATSPDAYYPRVIRGWVRLRQGDVAGAREDADAVQRLRPRDFFIDSEPLVIAILALGGDSAGARRRAGAMAALFPGTGPISYGAAQYLALGYARAGQPELAIDMLERSRISAINSWWAMQDPAFALLRGHPRFERLLAELSPK